MSEWKPIESAPAAMHDADEDKDPPRVLLWVEKAGIDGKGEVAFGRVYIWRRTGTRRAVAEGFTGGWRITHWMPIPDRP